MSTDTNHLPRPLLPSERDTLEFVLNHSDFPGRDALLAQASAATVTGKCNCGCASIELTVPPDLPAATGPDVSSPIQNEATALNDEGEPIGGVLVFLEDGYLSYLEIYNFEDMPINPFSPTDHLRPETVERVPPP